ncbi:MAG: hypothetical protein NZ900_01495 [Synergistetes bacterium]|nr:hypothetical protein [Synergistota bacterium]MDW8191601.1 hypothetical protein [Synergistota bacterium]
MSFSKKLSVLGTALLVMLLFALPAFAAWQSTPIQSVTFKETIPQNAIVIDGNKAYVAAHDGRRLVVYRWDLATGSEKIDGIWLIDGNLVSGSAGAYPSMALYNYDKKFIILSYISGNSLKAALFDGSNWYVHTVPCADLQNPRYTSVAVGYATGAFTNGATVAAIAVGGDSGVYLATLNMAEVAADSATQAEFEANLNWEVSKITSYEATGVDVFVTPQNFAGNWAGLIFVSYIARKYGQSGSGLYLAVSKDGKSWSGAKGCVALVDSDPNVVVDACTVGADTSLWVGSYTATEAAIGIAYVTKGGNILFTSFATSATWDIIGQLPQVAQSEFKKNVVVQKNARPCNIDMGITGLASQATVAIAYFDTRDPDLGGGACVVYATNAALGGTINWLYYQVDKGGYGAITLVSDTGYYYYSWATAGDLLKLATASADNLRSWTPASGRTLANASLFGMGYSVAGSGDYHASFYDAILRTLNYVKFGSDYKVLADATTLINRGAANKPGWFEIKGEALGVKIPDYLDAGWNTDIDLDSKGAPHIVFTSILSGSASNLDSAVNPATPATVSYVTAITDGWTTGPEIVSYDYNVRDVDIELTSVGDMKDAIHVAWVTVNKGVFYRQKKGASWQTIKSVDGLESVNILADGNLDMKVLVLSNGDELMGLAIGYNTTSSSYVYYAWKEASEQTFSHVFKVETFSGYEEMCEVALALYSDKATVVYSSPGGRGSLMYEEDVAQVSVDNGWKGTRKEINDGGCPLCERKDPFAVAEGGKVYVLYKYLDYPTATKYYFRFGDVAGTPEYVVVGGNKQESKPVFANASRTEALMSKALFFYKGAAGVANAMVSEVPPPAQVTVDVNPASLSFGEVNVGDTKELTLTVVVDNPTAAAVNVSVSAPTGFSVTPASWQVAAGARDSKTVKVTFAPTDDISYSGSITITVGTVSKTVSVSGTGKAVGGGGCSAADVGSLGLALLLIGPAILALRKK